MKRAGTSTSGQSGVSSLLIVGAVGLMALGTFGSLGDAMQSAISSSSRTRAASRDTQGVPEVGSASLAAEEAIPTPSRLEDLRAYALDDEIYVTAGHWFGVFPDEQDLRWQLAHATGYKTSQGALKIHTGSRDKYKGVWTTFYEDGRPRKYNQPIGHYHIDAVPGSSDRRALGDRVDEVPGGGFEAITHGGVQFPYSPGLAYNLKHADIRSIERGKLLLRYSSRDQNRVPIYRTDLLVTYYPDGRRERIEWLIPTTADETFEIKKVDENDGVGYEWISVKRHNFSKTAYFPYSAELERQLRVGEKIYYRERALEIRTRDRGEAVYTRFYTSGRIEVLRQDRTIDEHRASIINHFKRGGMASRSRDRIVITNDTQLAVLDYNEELERILRKGTAVSIEAGKVTIDIERGDGMRDSVIFDGDRGKVVQKPIKVWRQPGVTAVAVDDDGSYGADKIVVTSGTRSRTFTFSPKLAQSLENSTSISIGPTDLIVSLLRGDGRTDEVIFSSARSK